MDEVKVDGPRRPAGSPPLVWAEVAVSGDLVRVQIITPDLGVIYDGCYPQGVCPVAAWMACRAAISAAGEHGRN